MKYNLSEITEVIRNRRSIAPENYSSRKVHREIVENILGNAIWAPTHGLTQPWRFKIYQGGKVSELMNFLASLYEKKNIGDAFSPRKFEKIKKRGETVSTVVVLCMKRDPEEKIPEVEEIEAVACAVQNMYLTCTAYGIGGFWSSPKFIYSDEMRDYLDLGENDRCLGLFYMGYPDIEWPKGHRKPLEYVTEWHVE